MKNKVLPAVLSPFGLCRPEFQQYTLENGLQVVLCRDVFKPKVTYHVSSGMEPPGQTGFPKIIPEPFIAPEKPGTYEAISPGTTQTNLRLAMAVRQSNRPAIHNTIAFYSLRSKQYSDIVHTEIRDKNCYSGIESLYHTRISYVAAYVDPPTVQQVMRLVGNILTTYPETYGKDGRVV